MRRPGAFGLSRAYRLPAIESACAGPIASTRDLPEGELVFEIAWDGQRVMACRVGTEVRLVSDDLREWNDAFPSVARALATLPATSLVCEGFLCALDPTSMRPSFERLRAHVEGTRTRVMFALCDLLHLDGEDLRSKPLAERREKLRDLAAKVGAPLALSGSIGDTLEKASTAARALGAAVLARSANGAFLLDGPTAKQKLSPPPKVTNESKVMYPRDGFTKRDVVAYYDAVSAMMLPYLRERPVVCQRWPDGIDDFTWYQHRLPPKAPDYLRGVMIDGNRRILIDDRDALLWMVNQAALTFHGWASRVERLREPDWLIFDLDPGERTTWNDTIQVASAVRELLELLELPSVPKTSGKKGIHVLVPVTGHSIEDVHEVAQRAAKTIAKALPQLVTLESAKEKRGGRLLLDHLQSFVGKSLVMPYSLRDADGATVSTPLAWSEVTVKLDPRAFTLRTLPARLDAVGDLAAPLLRGTSLSHALARLPP